MYKNSKHTVLFPLLLAAGVVLGLVLGQYLGRNTTTSQLKGMLSRMALPDNKLSYTLSLIENQYVDSVSMDSLAEHVIPMLVKELDPHSVYIPAAEMQALNEPLEGEFDGIGVVFNMATDTVIVLNVIPQGPSDKAGVKAGVSIKPKTPVAAVVPYLNELDLVLVMSVEPGFGGQAFIPESLERISELRNLLNEKGLTTDIEVDGGIYHKNVAEVLAAGANVMVSGSGVFKGDIKDNTAKFMEILNGNV